MKKIIFLAFFILCIFGISYAFFNELAGMLLDTDVRTSAASGVSMQNNTDKLAMSFYPKENLAITAVDMYFDIAGDVTDTNLTLEVQTDNAGNPSGTYLGAPTAKFSAPAADGLVGEQTLGSNTGVLAKNTRYWLVCNYSSGGELNATDYLKNMQTDNSKEPSLVIKTWNGTAWKLGASTTTSYMVKYSDGTYSGFPFSSGVRGLSGAEDIFSTNVQGVMVVFGTNVTLSGCAFQFDITGTPGILNVSVYENKTLKYSGFKEEALMGDGSRNTLLFNDSVSVLGNTPIYIIFSQSGTSGSNDYDMYGRSVQSAYYNWSKPQHFDFVYGNISNQTVNLTVETDWVPYFMIYFTDFQKDLNTTVGGAPGGNNTTYYQSGSLFNGGFER